ncbi:MAG: leucine-rich repeat domain-containing protein [Clostridia bacterium]|nr:leucine-rich repeat domain-containing protein [Clostridia bacterium]
MKRQNQLLRIVLCLLLVCTLLIVLAACGNTSDGGNNGDDSSKKPGGYENEWEDEGNKKPDDDKTPSGSDDEGAKPGPGGSAGAPSADMTLVDPDQFYLRGQVADPSSDITFLYEGYLGRYTAGMFEGDVEFSLCYGDPDDPDEVELECEITAPISVDAERFSNDMTWFISTEDMAVFKTGYLESVGESSFESAVERIILEVAGAWPTDEQLETFLDEKFGYEDFVALVENFGTEGLVLGTSADFGFDEFGDRDPVDVRLDVGEIYDSPYVYGEVKTLESFVKQVEVGYYYLGDESETVYYDFSLADHLDAFAGLGLTFTEEGLVVNDTFFDVLHKNYSTDKKGVIVSVNIDIFDGTVQPLYIEVCTSHTPRIYYDIQVPESVGAELNFEEGFDVTFDVTLAGEQHTVTVEDRTYEREVRSSAYIGQISQWLKKYGEARGNDETAFTLIMPDDVTFTAFEIPVSEYTFLDNLKKEGSFVFTYGDRTTVLNAGNEIGSQLGIYFDSMVSNLTVESDGETQSLLMYLIFGDYEASPTAYTIEAGAELDAVTERIPVTVTLQLDSYLSHLELVNVYLLDTDYYIGEEVSIAPGFQVKLLRRTTFRGELSVEQVIAVTADMIEGFDTSVAADNLYMSVEYNGFGSNLISYIVRPDPVVSIDVVAPFFGTYIIGTNVDFNGAVIKATHESGKIVDVPLAMEHLSDLPTVTGRFDLTVTYEGVTDTHSVDALKVASAAVYEGLGSHYLIGEKPTEATVRVEFESNTMGYDYDYVVIGETELATFDTATAGNCSWVYTFAGVEISHSYQVVEKAYVSYTSNGIAITINGLVLDSVPEHYYEIANFNEIVIPAEIDGIPVTAIAAYAFKDKNMIGKITLPESIVSVGNYAFQNATGLVEINIPQSVTSLGTKILSGCTGLAKLYISGDTPISKYFSTTLPTALTVYVNEGEDTLCSRFLLDLGENYIAKVVLPSTLVEITMDSSTVFWSLGSFGNILAFDANPGGYYTAADGVLFADYGKELLYYPTGKTTESYIIPDGVERVTYMADNVYLKSVTIPATVTLLGENVFRLDEELTTVTFLGSLAALPDGCFSCCEKLVNFNFPTGVTSIGVYCFERTAIPTIVIPKGVTTIGAFAFNQCKVQRLAVPSSAMASFLQLGDQLMTNLTEFAYDGSVPLKKINAVYDYFRLNSPIEKVYIYDTTSFAGGVGNGTSTPIVVYIDKCVTSMTYGERSDQDTTYRYEGSSISNESGFQVFPNAIFTKWYLG